MSAELLEEIEVLQSIYGELVTTNEVEKQWNIEYTHPDKGFSVEFLISSDYPAGQDSVTFHIKSQDDDVFEESIENVNQMIENRCGECVLFQAIESIREFYEDNKSLLQPSFVEIDDAHDTLSGAEGEGEDLEPEKAMSRDPRIMVDYALPPGSSGLRIIHGPITIQQKSNFQSHLAEVHSMDDVHAFRSEVLSDRKIACATHNIFAYRFTDSGTGICHHDCDDDGETAAASRVAEMMRLMGVNNVAVIITRWYGGIKLGPDRFKLICNSARNLLEENGFGHEAQKQAAKAAKAMKAAQQKESEKEREKEMHSLKGSNHSKKR